MNGGWSWLLLIASATNSLLTAVLTWFAIPHLFLPLFQVADIYKSFPVDPQQVNAEFIEMMWGLWPWTSGQFDGEYWTVNDIQHLHELRWLLLAVAFVWLMSGLFVLMYRHLGMPKLGARMLIIPVAAVILMVLWFDELFYLLHLFIFPGSDNWQLDPSSSLLIRYFTNSIFQWVGLAVVAVALLVFLCQWYLAATAVVNQD